VGNLSDGRTANGARVDGPKKVYTAPTLVRWGSVEDLTFAGGADAADGSATKTSGGG
jgi:hypothetical protein